MQNVNSNSAYGENNLLNNLQNILKTHQSEHRVFIAINPYLDKGFIEFLQKIKQKLHYENIKWVDAKLIHCTLLFIGSVRSEKIGILKDAIRNTTSKHYAFETRIKELGIFGSKYQPRVIKLQLFPNEPIINIYNTLKEELKDADLHLDTQNFRPHVKIGRIKDLKDKKLFHETIDTFRNSTFSVSKINEIILYESILSSKGPEYKQLANYKLKEII